MWRLITRLYHHHVLTHGLAELCAGIITFSEHTQALSVRFSVCTVTCLLTLTEGMTSNDEETEKLKDSQKKKKKKVCV